MVILERLAQRSGAVVEIIVQRTKQRRLHRSGLATNAAEKLIPHFSRHHGTCNATLNVAFQHDA
jgi:hypothetical protein